MPRGGRGIEADDSQAELLTRQSASCEEGLLSRPPSTADREFLAALVVHRQGEVDEGDVRAVDVLEVISEDRRASVEIDYGVRLLPQFGRSEEHTSELQSLMRISYAVFC